MNNTPVFERNALIDELMGFNFLQIHEKNIIFILETIRHDMIEALSQNEISDIQIFSMEALLKGWHFIGRLKDLRMFQPHHVLMVERLQRCLLGASVCAFPIDVQTMLYNIFEESMREHIHLLPK